MGPSLGNGWSYVKVSSLICAAVDVNWMFGGFIVGVQEQFKATFF